MPDGWNSNPSITQAAGALPMIGKQLCRMAIEDFGDRDILTGAEISAIRVKLAGVVTNLNKIDTELADPASRFRLMSGGTGLSPTGVGNKTY